jgi:putative transposase
LRGEIAQRLEQFVYEVALEHHWYVLSLGIEPHCVHLFIRSNPYPLPTDIARRIKGSSSHILREEFPWIEYPRSSFVDWTRLVI